ncbi:hypothetical protein IE985_17025 [Klebsiella pneumoniae]|nr:hypothetical protein [Klebsiella pneumoniae]
MALRLPTYYPTPMLAQRRRAIAAGTEPLYAGRRLTPCPAYGAIARLFCRAAADALPGLRVQTQYVNRRQTWGR